LILKNLEEKANELHIYFIGALTRSRITNDLTDISNMKQAFKKILAK
jgi:hypothetical protein